MISASGMSRCGMSFICSDLTTEHAFKVKCCCNELQDTK